MKCPYFKSFQFTEANDCELVDAIEEISTSLLKEFHDVVRVGDSRAVLLEPLHEIPRGELGDLTGDHGKQMAKFLRCGKRPRKTLPAITDLLVRSALDFPLKSLKNQYVSCVAKRN